jgi:AcrR family transcriptional regulator
MHHQASDRSLAQATRIFWERGYHATSMRHLQQVMDLRPGSLYARYGNKDRLFLAALRHYTDMARDQLRTCVEGASSPLHGLRAFISDLVLARGVASPGPQCLLARSLTELGHQEAELLQEVRRLMGDMEVALSLVLQDAIRHGELPATVDPQAAARYLQIELMGLRAYACLNRDGDVLNQHVNRVFAGLPGIRA